MTDLFLNIFNMSITAGWLIVAVVIIRLFLKKSPKYITCILWGLVMLRLICPFSFESVLSLVPSTKTIPQNITTTETPSIESGIPIVNTVVNDIISDSLDAKPNINDSIGDKTEPKKSAIMTLIEVSTIIWLIGVLSMIIYALISYFIVKRKVREAVPYKDNIWICDSINTPFILGLFKPQIYICPSVEETDFQYVIAHEKAHLKRLDHILKPVGFILLAIYWFNPLIWLFYILFCRDIELACDEKVVKTMDIDIRKSYSTALINCSAPGRPVTPCPLAFGEVGIKQRIKSILHYKKPSVLIITVSILICIAVAVCFLTNPVKSKATPELSTNYYEINEPQYKELITKIQNAYKNNFETVTTDDLNISFVYNFSNWETSKIGYYVTDLDNNGINELLIGDSTAIIRYNPNNSANELISYVSIYDIFTINNGKLHHVFKGGERDVIYQYENNILRNEGSSSDSESYDAYYNYKNGNLSLIEDVRVYKNIKPVNIILMPLNPEIKTTNKQIPSLKEVKKYYHSENKLFDILSYIKREDIHKSWGKPESTTKIDNMFIDAWAFDNENFKGHKISLYYDKNNNLLKLDFFYSRE